MTCRNASREVDGDLVRRDHAWTRFTIIAAAMALLLVPAAQAHLNHQFTAEIGDQSIPDADEVETRPWFNYTNDDPTSSGLTDVHVLAGSQASELDLQGSCSAGPTAQWTVQATDDPNRLTFTPPDDAHGDLQFTVCFNVTNQPDHGTEFTLSVFGNESGALGEQVQSSFTLTLDTVAPSATAFETDDGVTDPDGSTPDGLLDGVVVTFDEPPELLGGGAIWSDTAENWTITDDAGNTIIPSDVTAPGTGDLASDQVYLHFGSGVELDTGETPTVEYADADTSSPETIVDEDGNAVQSLGPTEAADLASPVAVEMRTLDDLPSSQPDGRLDGIEVVFSEPVDDRGDGSDPSNWTISGDYGDDADHPSNVLRTGPDTLVLEFDPLGQAGQHFDTDAQPSVDYAGTGLVDQGGNASWARNFTDEQAADGADPVFRKVAVLDTDEDGHVDTLRVRFSEPVDEGSDALDPDFEPEDDWELGGGYDRNVQVERDRAEQCGGQDQGDETDPDACIYVTFAEKSFLDTDATPDLTYDPEDDQIPDLAGNELSPRTVGSVDRAKPLLPVDQIPAKTRDLDGDGRIDAIAVTFSEPIDDSTFESGAWSVEKDGPSLDVTGFDTGASADDETIRITFEEDGPRDSGVTDAFNVTHSGDTPEDLAGNPPAPIDDIGDSAGEILDGARPVALDAFTRDADGDGLLDTYDVTFSEEVQLSSSDASGWLVDGAPADSLVDIGPEQIAVGFPETTLRTDAVPSLEYTADPRSIEDTASTPNSLAATTVDDTEDRAGPVILSVFGEAGDTEVEVTFSEPVLGSGPNGEIVADDLDYDNVNSGGATQVDSVDHLAEDETATVTLDSALVSGDIRNDRIVANGTEDPDPDPVTIEDLEGNLAEDSFPATDRTEMIRPPGPFLLQDPSGNIGSTLVELTFNEGVDDGNGGDLTRNAFGLSPTSGGDATSIESVDHEAGSRVVRITVDAPLNVDDVTAPRADIVIRSNRVFADGQAAPAGEHPIRDVTPPTVDRIETMDRDTDGVLDWVRVVFSEPIDDATLVDAEWSVVGPGATTVQTCPQADPNNCPGSSVDDRRVFVEITAGNDTGERPKVDYTAGSLADLVGNLAESFLRTSTDKAKPVVLSAEVDDLRGGGGWMDTYRITFSEAVRPATLAPGEWDVDRTQVRTIERVADDAIDLVFDERHVLFCDADAPELTYAPIGDGVLRDTADNPLVPVGEDDIAETTASTCIGDGTDFIVLATRTLDSDGNGFLDGINVTLSRPINETASTFDPASWTLEDPYGDGSNHPTSVDTGDAAGDARLTLHFAEEFSDTDDSDTGARPRVGHAGGDVVCAPCAGDPTIASFSRRSSDGAGPLMPEALALDRDDDGLSDAYLLVFSEPVDDASFLPGEWAIQNRKILGYDTRSINDDDTAQLFFNQSQANQQPDLTFDPVHDGFRDLSGAVMPGQDPAEQAQDDEPPSIPGPITSPDFPPIDTGEWGPANGTFSWEPATDNFGIDGYTTAVDDEPVRDPDPGNVTADNSTEVSGLSGGEHTFSVRAIDLVGNHGPARNYTFQVDADLPVAASVSSSTHDAPPTCNEETTAQFSWSGASDPTSGLADTPYEYAIDDAAPASTSDTNATITGLDDGEHTFTVTTFDKAGNSNASSYTFFVDTQGPSVNVTVPPIAGSSVPISWSGDDACSTVDSYTAEVRKQGASSWTELASGSTTQVTFNPTAGDGGYEVRVRATDALGHEGSFSTAQFVVDTSPPGQVSGLMASFANATGVVQLSWQAATDDGSGVVGYNIYRSTQADAGYSKITSQPVNRLSFSDSTVQSNTLYHYRVRAVDGAGNEGDAAQASVQTLGGGAGEVRICTASTSDIESALGVDLPTDGLRGTDEDGDRVPDAIANTDAVEIRSTPEIEGSRWILLARPGEGPRAACVLATGQIETIGTVLGQVQSSQARDDQTVVTITADKSDGWIEIEVDDPFPDKDVVKVETADGRQIPLSQLDRRDGKLRIVDDPETTYHVFYQGTEGADPPFPWLLVGGLMVGILVVLGGAVWYLSEQEEEASRRR